MVRETRLDPPVRFLDCHDLVYGLYARILDYLGMRQTAGHTTARFSTTRQRVRKQSLSNLLDVCFGLLTRRLMRGPV